MLRILRGQMLDSPFPSHGNYSPIVSILIRLLLHFGREGYSAHDPITEFLVQDSLVCKSIVLHNLIQSVDQGLLWRHVHCLPSEGVAGQLGFQPGLLYPKDSCKSVNIFRRGLSLPVKDSCNGHFVASELLRDLFEGELLLSLGFEEGACLYGKAIC